MSSLHLGSELKSTWETIQLNPGAAEGKSGGEGVGEITPHRVWESTLQVDLLDSNSSLFGEVDSSSRIGFNCLQLTPRCPLSNPGPQDSLVLAPKVPNDPSAKSTSTQGYQGPGSIPDPLPIFSQVTLRLEHLHVGTLQDVNLIVPPTPNTIFSVRFSIVNTSFMILYL